MTNPSRLPLCTGLPAFVRRGYRFLLRRAGWAPPLLLVLVLAMAAFAPETSYESPLLLIAANFLFLTLVGGAIAVLVGHTFLKNGALSFLFLGCGALAWGAAGGGGAVVAVLGREGGLDPNVLVTIHNLSAWISAGCHLAAATVARRWGRPPPLGRRPTLALGYGGMLGLVACIMAATLTGWTETFFVPGEGGTTLRQQVLFSTIFMYGLTALLLREGGPVPPSSFARWYGHALLLIAVGLTGVLLAESTGSMLNWLGRLAQYLGGLYMLVAILAARREARRRGFELKPPGQETPYRYWVALAIVAAIAVLRLVFLPHLENRAAYITFFPAVMFSALYGGFRAGMLATFLSLVAVCFFWLPAPDEHWGIAPAETINAGVFLLGSLISAWVAENMHRAVRRARRAEAEILAHHDQLEALIRLRTSALQREIVERQRAEEELRRREEGFRTLADGVPAIIARFDPQLRYLFVSRGVQVLTDRRPESFIGQTNEALGMPAPVCASWARTLETVFRTGQAQELEFEWPGAQACRRFLMLAVPESGAGGSVCSVISISTDITERKQAEEALKAAKNEAERANNAKSRFLAAASHDLRQPLSALALYVDVLSDRLAADTPTAPLLHNMKNCVGTLSELLTDLLDLSTLEAGVITPDISDFALNDVLYAVVSMHAPLAHRKGLQLRCRPSAFTARTDPVLFRRLLGNFVSNAVRYTRTGGILIACRQRHGRHWVEVWDTGIGIPADKTAEIFEEFIQLGNEERSRSKGSGLGLAIVSRTASLLGLQVRVESRPGRGSLFAIEIPPGRLVTRTEPLPRAQRPLCIALVEDNADLRQALVYALEGEGHQVVAAASGEELRPLLAEAMPDIVVSDYRLGGGKTGLDIISLVRTLVDDHLPAVIITGDTDPEFMRNMANRRITVVHKPFDIDRLQRSISELAGAGRERSVTAVSPATP